MLGVSFVVLVAVLLGSWLIVKLAAFLGAIAALLAGLWCCFAVFVLNFFRDPNPRVPADPRVIVSPAHGTVDVIDEVQEPEVMGGRCRRVSIFLSVFDVHVQNAPVAGRVILSKYSPGQFLNAMKTESAALNENLLLGIETAGRSGEKIGVRLLAGLIARRIIPWISLGDTVEKGQRISLIQFGSRADIYLPLNATVKVQLGQKVRGGETPIAERT